jgi:hypothetical protein
MQFGIIGSGSWATALAKILTDNGNTIHWWVRNADSIAYLEKRRHNPHYLHGAYFDPRQLVLSNDIQQVVSQSEVLVIAVPSAFVESALEQIPAALLKGKKNHLGCKRHPSIRKSVTQLLPRQTCRLSAGRLFYRAGPLPCRRSSSRKIILPHILRNR